MDPPPLFEKDTARFSGFRLPRVEKEILKIRAYRCSGSQLRLGPRVFFLLKMAVGLRRAAGRASLNFRALLFFFLTSSFSVFSGGGFSLMDWLSCRAARLFFLLFFSLTFSPLGGGDSGGRKTSSLFLRKASIMVTGGSSGRELIRE